jgi:hypothetical protein
MAANCWPVLVSVLLGAGPTVTPAPVSEPTVVETAGTAGAAFEPRFCFDCPAPWLHGYIQEVPQYAGCYSFRPYNYKHVFAQSQIATGWGFSPTAPYSQQYWHREPAAQTNAALPPAAPMVIVPASAWVPQPSPNR